MALKRRENLKLKGKEYRMKMSRESKKRKKERRKVLDSKKSQHRI
jgi:hypothetical protein